MFRYFKTHRRDPPSLEADLIVLDRNPLDDINAVRDVLLVVNYGKIAVNHLKFWRFPPLSYIRSGTHASMGKPANAIAISSAG